MIRAQIVLDEDGTLLSLTVAGHAGSAPAGKDLVCAAVSSLVRTAVRTLQAHPGLPVWSDAPEPGRVDLRVDGVSAPDRLWLKGVSDTVLQGLRDLEGDAPGFMEVNVKRSKSNGS